MRAAAMCRIWQPCCIRALVLLSTVSSILKVRAEIGSDSVCQIHALAPFEDYLKKPIYGLDGITDATIGFSQLAAAVLAVQHFNERNSSIVPELADLAASSCDVTLNLTHAFNGAEMTSTAIRSMQEIGPPSCAIVGPFDDFTALDVSVLAQAHQIPLVTTRTYDLTLVEDTFHQFTSSVHPDLVSSAARLIDFLMDKGRTNFISYLYDFGSANFQRREALGAMFDDMQLDWFTSSFDAAVPSTDHTRSVLSAMAKIKNVGYRTIIISQLDARRSFQLIADAAEELGMNNGEYFYVFFDDAFEPNVVRDNTNLNITNLVAGSAWIMPPPLKYIPGREPTFDAIYMEQGKEFVDQVQELNPIEPGEPAYTKTNDTFFQSVPPTYGADLMFDAVMSVGFGACIAQQEKLAMGGGSVITGAEHQAGVRKVNFAGANGRIRIGGNGFPERAGRNDGTATWASVNTKWEGFQITDMVDPEMNNGSLSWIQMAEFEYRDGTTTPPKFLRDEPEQNHLPNELRIVGFVLMGTTILMSIGSATWVFIRRKHRIVAASQPEFLYMICFGAILQASAIFPKSFDEGSGWDVGQLSRGCMCTPWLLTLGHCIVYSALFTKQWRLNKVLQFTRRKIEIGHVALPMAVLLVTAILILILWTALDPLQWERKEIDSATGESIGNCESDTSMAFIIPLIIVMLIPTVLTAVMAYKTKDVDEVYTESWWIFVLIILQIEVVMISAPVIIILREESAEGQYFGIIFILWSFPMTTLSLLFFPKMMAYRRAIKGIEGPTHKRGAKGNSRISGVNVPPPISGTSNPSQYSYSKSAMIQSSRFSEAIPEGETERDMKEENGHVHETNGKPEILETPENMEETDQSAAQDDAVSKSFNEEVGEPTTTQKNDPAVDTEKVDTMTGDD